MAVEFQRERTKELTEKSPGSFADNILQFATDASDSSSHTFLHAFLPVLLSDRVL